MSECTVSFVVPFRNEAAFLRRMCNSLARQTLGGRAEILLVDGLSGDGSREIAEEFVAATCGPAFRVIDNPERSTPYALNHGIAAARGAIVGIGGAHSVYPADYFERALIALAESQADVIGGGVTRFVPSHGRFFGAAMGMLYQSPMGAGVAGYHRLKSAADVDTVYGGFYRRHVLDAVGEFNTRLTRNQDNEFNARVTAAGFRIRFDPSLSTEYVIKTDVRTFFVRAWRQGLYLPEAWLLTPESFRWRHAIPVAFVVYVFAASLFFFLGFRWAFAALGLYAALLILAAVRLWVRGCGWRAMLTPPVFALFHLLYGLGTLSGLVLESIRAISGHREAVVRDRL